MDEANLARATEPVLHHQGVGKGTGLGLPMVHGLVETIRRAPHAATARLGEPTRIDLWLPRSRGSPHPHGRSSGGPVQEPEAPAAWPCWPSMTTSWFLTNTAAMLEDLGHRVIVAASAEAALKALNTATGWTW